MRLQSHTSVLHKLKQLDKQFDMSFSGLAILAAIAALHITSAGIDLIEAAKATTLGPANLIQVTDIVIGTALALFPFMRMHLRRFKRAWMEGAGDCSYR